MIGLHKNTFPKDWKIVTIPEVLFFQEGPGVRKNQFKTEGVKLLNVGNINENKLDLNTTSLYISNKEAANKYSHFLVDEGDLLIACSGIAVNNFRNKIAFARKENLPLCMNTSTMRFKILERKEIAIEFFYYYLQTNLFADQLRRLITGSAQLNFGPSHVKRIQIPLPPIDQQKRIAEILNKVDALRKKNNELLAEYDELLQATFIDIFGDIALNSKKWTIEKLSDVIRNIDSGWSPKCEDKPREKENEWAVLMLSAVTQRYYQAQFNKKLPLELNPKVKNEVKVDNLLFSRKNTRELVGATVYVFNTESRLMLSDTIFRLNYLKDKINGIYLFFLFNSINFRKNIQRLATGSAGSMPNISKEKLLKLEVPLPPVDLQNKFGLIVKNIESQKTLVKKNIQEGEDLFNSLVQKVFKGEL